ncbi:MAG TPA: NADH-quinone oxidoreductase subunit C [Chloroflexia bacterium]|nr:NADH-quinone oxidoreductase subunit C [Chloroflexia bacterium]
MTQTSDGTVNPEGSQPAPAPSLIETTRFPNVRPSPFRAADGTPTFIVPAEEILDVVRYLRDEGGFRLFEDITAVDWLPKEPRFEVVYHFLNIEARQPIRLKVPVSGTDPKVPSLTGLFTGANWFEREVYDLFGITFMGHPDLRRIEMPVDWEGHPLRKDYPVTGPRRPNLPANQFRPEGRNGAPQV